MISSIRETSEQILSNSKKRWLTPTEIFVLLSHEPMDTGLLIQTSPIMNPKDGQLHVFDEQVFAQHKSSIDNINWAKKKGQNKKLQETYIKLKIEGKEVISGVYSKAAENESFRRRSYRLLDKNRSKYCIVHYRLSNDDDRPDQHSVPPSVLHHASKHLPPGTLTMPDTIQHRELIKVEQHEEEHDLDWVLDLMTHDHDQFEPQPKHVNFEPQFTDPQFVEPLPVLSPTPFPAPLQRLKSIPIPAKPASFEITIIDFSPSIIAVNASMRKLIICLSGQIEDCALKIGFTSAIGYQLVSGTLLPGGNVIRCNIPGLAPGRWSLTVLNENVELASCEESLEVIESPSSPRGILGKRMHSSNPMASRSSMGLSTSIRFDSPNNGNDGMDRKYKIRLVERLTCVRTAMGASDNSFMKQSGSILNTSINNTNSVNMENSIREAAEKVELNSVELLNISDHELKAVVEEQIVKLVQDLIRRASLDSEIRNEIDTLDSAGFNLLHYSCLYNQVALLPILLMRGAKINKKTATGSTALHLAANSGYFAVVKLLVEHKADIDEKDENGNTAVSLANMNGHNDIATFLESALLNRVNTSMSKMSTSVYANNMDIIKLFEETVTSLCLADKCALLMTDAKSMLSDLDKEYLTHAMAMMTINETDAIQIEVKNIEKSDVGTWLLSKHNDYLKDAVKDSPKPSK